MNGAAWLLALATLGVDYGWRLDEKGQIEYIVQISPAQWESLRESPDGVSSNISPEVVRHVKKIRIVVGNGALPRDPLPAFPAEGEPLGSVTPINVGTSRVTTVGGDFTDVPTLESTVTPLDNLNAPRNALPGPGRDGLGDASDAVGELLPIPPIPRASNLLNELGPLTSPLASTNIRPQPRRDNPTNDGSWRPNVNAPDTSDTWSPTNRNASYSATLPQRELPSPAAGNYGVETPAKNPLSLFFAVCGLCLSVGGNVFLGWVAWGYYMKYRESFEAMRSNWGSNS